MKILIAEDEAVTRSMLEAILPTWGFDVLVTTNGREAWEVLAKPDPPRLAIIDWMMPGLDGLQLTRRVRTEIEDDYIYVLLLTSRDARADLVAGLEAGADDYLVKPFDPHELRVRINAARRAVAAHEQLKLLNRELNRKNKRLGELTETAHRFVDNVSHEFRTPLTVIKEFSSILADGLGGPVNETQGEYLRTVIRSVQDLSQMVDDLLDSSKLKAGTLRVERRRHNVEEVLNMVRPLVASRAKARNITINESVEPGLPPVFVDLEKAARTIVNLLINAVKFSPDGTTVEVAGRGRDDGDVEIAVTDQGPGLTPEDLEQIFQRFKQVGTGCQSSTKGFGLGLNIAHELAWLNLGTVSVESVFGDGSTFAMSMVPADPEAIVSRFFRGLDELASWRNHLAVLRIEPWGADDPSVSRFIMSSCYSTDLVLPDRSGRGVLAIGLTDSPRGWQERLERLGANADDRRPGGSAAPKLRIERLGTWPARCGREEITDLVLAHIGMEHACG